METETIFMRCIKKLQIWLKQPNAPTPTLEIRHSLNVANICKLDTFKSVCWSIVVGREVEREESK